MHKPGSSLDIFDTVIILDQRVSDMPYKQRDSQYCHKNSSSKILLMGKTQWEPVPHKTLGSGQS